MQNSRNSSEGKKRKPEGQVAALSARNPVCSHHRVIADGHGAEDLRPGFDIDPVADFGATIAPRRLPVAHHEARVGKFAFGFVLTAVRDGGTHLPGFKKSEKSACERGGSGRGDGGGILDFGFCMERRLQSAFLLSVLRSLLHAQSVGRL